MELRLQFEKKRINIEIVDIFIILVIVIFIYGLINTGVSIGKESTHSAKITLAYSNLPLYAWFSILRQFIAFGISLIFSITYGYIASHANKRVETIMIALLDVMQSIPLLSFMPIFVIFLINIFTNIRIGIELSSILLIFTSQVWNMAFSVYGSMKSIPRDFKEVSSIFNFNKFLRFIYIELPSSIIGLVWNSMMSVAGGWFFLMASEMFILGGKDFRLPGLGSYLQLAAIEGNTPAIFAGLLTIILIIVLIDRIIWRPLIAWSQRFKTETREEEADEISPILTQLKRSRIIKSLNVVWNNFSNEITSMELKQGMKKKWLPHQVGNDREKMDSHFRGNDKRRRGNDKRRHEDSRSTIGNDDKAKKIVNHSKKTSLYISIIINSLLIIIAGYGVIIIFLLIKNVSVTDWLKIVSYDIFTLLRVITAIFISLLWTVPLGVSIGLNKKLANKLQPLIQIFASIPATAIFPIIIMWLINSRGGINLASIILMLLGTQWYIIFNVIAGAQSIPADLKESSEIFGLKGLQKFKILILPSILPNLIIGLITATGGAWNASIVSEYVQFRGKIYMAKGIGSLINIATESGNYSLLTGSTLIMIITVILINRYIWRRIYWKSIEHKS